MSELSLQLLRIRAVRSKTGLCKSEVYRLIGLGAFPRPIKIGQRSSAWLISEVDEWIHARVKDSRSHSDTRSVPGTTPGAV